jgi:hypothetical protein
MSQSDRAINMGGSVNTAVDRGDRAERTPLRGSPESVDTSIWLILLWSRFFVAAL